MKCSHCGRKIHEIYLNYRKYGNFHLWCGKTSLDPGLIPCSLTSPTCY